MKTITKKFVGCGIYCIINTVNQKRYIGSSDNCYLRLLDHRAELRGGVHSNKHLQNAYNKYGEGAFDCYILEFCDKSIKLEREKYYIDLFNSEYNIIKNPVEIHISEESRKKISESRISGFKAGTIKAYQSKEIHQYDLQGNYIKTFKSQKEMCKSIGIHECSIIRYFKNNYSQCAGYQWSYKKVDKLPAVKKLKKDNSYLNKAVIVTNMVNNTTIEFKSITDCAKYFNVTGCVIGYVIKHTNIYKNKYKIILKSAV